MSHRLATHRLAAATAAVVLVASGTARGALPCDADLDGDQVVGIVDFLELLAEWGTEPGGPPDFDGGGVGITDFLTLLANWGPVSFDYGPALPDPEAEQIALEMLGAGGPLLVPQEIFDRVDFDLTLIRHVAPSLQPQTHTPAWAPDQLLISLLEGAELDEYLCLNVVYQVIDIQLISKGLNLFLLTFVGNINIEALALIYDTAPEVNFAEPNGLIGGQNFWTPTSLGGGVWQWEIDDGWCDCFDGCDCHRFWVFETDAAGNIEPVSVDEIGLPWCDFNGDSC